jgi:hypothetical protein
MKRQTGTAKGVVNNNEERFIIFNKRYLFVKEAAETLGLLRLTKRRPLLDY